MISSSDLGFVEKQCLKYSAETIRECAYYAPATFLGGYGQTISIAASDWLANAAWVR
jgi:hypothetical protein